MAATENITLDFLAKQQRQTLEEMAEMRDDMRVMMAMMQRFDGTLSGLVNEVRAMHSRHDRLARQVRERLGEG